MKIYSDGNNADNLFYLTFFPGFFIYCEILTRFFLEKNIGVGFINYVYILLFSLAAGLVLYVLCSLFKSSRVNRIIANSLISLITVVYIVAIVLKNFFKTFLSIDFISANAGYAVQDFTGITFKVIFSSIGAILVFCVPIVLFNLPFISRRMAKNAAPMAAKASVLLLALFLHIGAAGLISASKEKHGLPSDNGIYTSEYEINQSIPRFGMLTTLRLEIGHLMFGIESYSGGAPDGGDHSDLPDINISSPAITTITPYEPAVTTPDTAEPPVTETPVPVFIPEPQTDGPYDLEALAESETNKTLKDMNEYFSVIEPTMTNEYTGLFKGKNLIFLTLEGFTPFMMGDLTPTLNMMMNSGVVFEEFYQPAWGGSTSTGEFSALMGLFPDGASAMQKTQGKDLSFTIGNHLKDLGYTSLAFHGNSYKYYKRDLTHKGLGYSDWIALGSGLETPKSGWLSSDLELFEKTIDFYIDKSPFNIYYMTLSGHCAYSKAGNAMSYKNWDKVEDLPYSEAVKAYIACNLELEYAMEYLLKRLDEAGILGDTVIVATGDHYPYGLEPPFTDKDYIPELITGEPDGKIDRVFEMYRSACFLYCSSIEEPIIVSKPSYSLDILPTLLNLFGATYDSRIFTGRDALSTAPGIVIFPNYSWISEVGRHNAVSGKFIPGPGYEDFASEEYVSEVSKAVRNRIAYGKSVQQHDYFGYLNKNKQLD